MNKKEQAETTKNVREQLSEQELEAVAGGFCVDELTEAFGKLSLDDPDEIMDDVDVDGDVIMGGT